MLQEDGSGRTAPRPLSTGRSTSLFRLNSDDDGDTDDDGSSGSGDSSSDSDSDSSSDSGGDDSGNDASDVEDALVDVEPCALVMPPGQQGVVEFRSGEHRLTLHVHNQRERAVELQAVVSANTAPPLAATLCHSHQRVPMRPQEP